jgi:hypothetical protein
LAARFVHLFFSKCLREFVLFCTIFFYIHQHNQQCGRELRRVNLLR